MKKRAAILVAFLCAFLSIANAVDAKTIYSIQVFSSMNPEEAVAQAAALSSEGYTPVQTVNKGERHAVVVGAFETYSDATFYKNKLRNGAFPGAFIIKRELPPETVIPALSEQELKTEEVFQGAIRSPSSNDLKGRKISESLPRRKRVKSSPAITDAVRNASNDSLSETELLHKSYALGREKKIGESIQAHRDFVRRFPSHEHAADSLLSIGHLLIRDKRTTEAASAFQEARQQYPGSLQSGEATLRLAYLKIVTKERQAARNLFSSIAAGEVPATGSVRAEAFKRLGCFDRADRLQSDPAFQLLHQGYEKIAESKPGEAESLFSQIVQNHASSEAAGEAALRLAYLKWAASLEAGDEPSRNALRADSQSWFESIARGEVKSSPPVRIEAMHRCARIYHGKKERIRALQAYQEIAALTDSDGSPDPDVHLEIAGLYMELALSENGSLENCIRECDQVLAIPGASDRTCATALTMKGECLFLLNRYEECSGVMNEVLSDFSACRSPSMTALLHIGAIHFSGGHYEDADTAFSRVVEEFTDEDNWPGKNFRGQAMLFLGRLETARKNKQKAGDYFKQAYLEWPGSKVARTSAGYLQNYFPHLWERITREKEAGIHE